MCKRDVPVIEESLIELSMSNKCLVYIPLHSYSGLMIHSKNNTVSQ